MNRRIFDATVLVIFLTVGAMSGLRISAKRRVLEGKTSGPVGAAASAVAVAL